MALSSRLPIITRKGRADGGHAVAIVGYAEQGFIIQNSWGPGWGAGGFALLPYEEMGRRAMEMALSDSVDPQNLLVPMPIQLRDSVRDLRQ